LLPAEDVPRSCVVAVMLRGTRFLKNSDKICPIKLKARLRALVNAPLYQLCLIRL
jgi:hypothetical protein